MVMIFSDSRYKIDRGAIQNQSKLVFKKAGFSDMDILNIIFVGSRKMRQIALDYKKEKTVHPILSFAYPDDAQKAMVEKEKVVGEIFICYPQAVLLAAEREKRVDVVIHQLIEHGVKTIAG